VHPAVAIGVALGKERDLGGVQATDLGRRMVGLGVQTLICTDVSRDGTLSGPNLESARALLEATQVAVIASGGIRSTEDLTALKALEPLGLAGAIVGKALYEGAIDLTAALAAVGAP